MREIRPSGSEGGVALTTPFLPLSNLSFASWGFAPARQRPDALENTLS